jgi:hypothetical protein
MFCIAITQISQRSFGRNCKSKSQVIKAHSLLELCAQTKVQPASCNYLSLKDDANKFLEERG